MKCCFIFLTVSIYLILQKQREKKLSYLLGRFISKFSIRHLAIVVFLFLKLSHSSFYRKEKKNHAHVKQIKKEEKKRQFLYF